MKRIRLKGQSLDAWEQWIKEEKNMSREFACRTDPHGEMVYKTLLDSTMYKYLLAAFEEAIGELRKVSQ